MTLGQIYTLAEATERLRTTGNALARVARRTGHCSQIGRDLRFSETDLEALWLELRVSPARKDRNSLDPMTDVEKRAKALLAGKRGKT